MNKIKWSVIKNYNGAPVICAELDGKTSLTCISHEQSNNKLMIARLIEFITFEIIGLSPIERLRQIVESNERYVHCTGRHSDAICLSPDHARELLELLK